MRRVVAGIDVGGTFTDLLLAETGADGGVSVRLAKVPTTGNQADGVLAAIEAAGIDAAGLDLVVHGTTATTNAVLERKTARVGLITTEGFRDVLELGRRTRPKPYGLFGTFEPLIPRELRRALGDVEAGARSAPEAEAADVLGAAVRAGRLPPFLLNPDVFIDGELLLSPDIWLLGSGVGGELDSRRFHSSQAALDDTLARHARAERRGVVLVHRSPSRFRQDPQGFVAELAARVAEVPQPPGLVVVPRGPVLPLPRRPTAAPVAGRP